AAASPGAAPGPPAQYLANRIPYGTGARPAWFWQDAIGNRWNAQMDDKPVDRPDKATVSVRQGTGPRAMVTVLLVSTLAAVAAMVVIYLYFYAAPATPPKV